MTEVAENALVDGRYRIRDRLGSGGMADVYAADDTHLGRGVALKMLHRRFARDEQFVERFRREASSAAKLQHPNVVNVFDRGEHDGTYYIAMEHLRGRSLKDIVAAEAPMGQQRAIDLGIQMLEAAGFAHSHGVIHRDLKPHNVIVGADGHVKVTDFGIARAGASEMTETGSIMGTAHYLSPEQAQGHAVTAASDLYSIGVVLYEMLTGRLPFVGESAVAIALKHLTEAPPPISSLRPDVHPVLEAAVMRALEKDPERRYGSAAEFVAALRSARDAIGGNGGQGTAMFAPVAAALPAEDGAAAAPAGAVVAAPPPDGGPPEGEGEDPRRRRRWLWPLLALLLLAGLGLGLYFALSGAQTVRVPGVVGQRLVPASAALQRAGLVPKVERRPSTAPVDEVIGQSPPGGADADRGSTVTLAVSGGPAKRTVPEVHGMPQDRAVRTLTKAGFHVETDEQSSGDVPSGAAIRTVPPAGTDLDVGSRVRLVVSTGPPQSQVPQVVGLTRSSAVARLDTQGFGVSVREQDSAQPKDQVIAQDPAGGTTVQQGSRVTITVSRGPAKTAKPPAAKPTPSKATVPSVVGESEAQARRDLEAAGFSVSTRSRSVDDPAQDGQVVDQRPGGGSRRSPGDTVVIVVGRKKAGGTTPPGGGTGGGGTGGGTGGGGTGGGTGGSGTGGLGSP